MELKLGDYVEVYDFWHEKAELIRASIFIGRVTALNGTNCMLRNRDFSTFNFDLDLEMYKILTPLEIELL